MGLSTLRWVSALKNYLEDGTDCYFTRAVASKLRKGVTFVRKWTLIRIHVSDACSMPINFIAKH